MNDDQWGKDLATELARYDAEKRLVLYIPPGYGAMSLLVAYITSKPTATVLISTPALAVAEHWSGRLSGWPQRRVFDLRSPGVALELAERGAVAEGDIVVATHASLARGIGKRTLADLHFDLLIVDDPAYAWGPEMVDWASSRVARMVMKVAHWPVGGTFQSWPVARFDTFPTPRIPRIERVPVEPWGEVERSAIAFTLENAVKHWGEPPTSRLALQQRLLAIAAAAEALDTGSAGSVDAEAVSEKAWSFVDELDGLESDPRLALTDRLLEELGESSGTIVVTGTVAEANYVASHLSQVLGRDVPAVTGAMSPIEREAVLPHTGFVISCTRSMVVSLALPDIDLNILFWVSPADPAATLEAVPAKAARMRAWVLV